MDARSDDGSGAANQGGSRHGFASLTGANSLNFIKAPATAGAGRAAGGADAPSSPRRLRQLVQSSVGLAAGAADRPKPRPTPCRLRTSTAGATSKLPPAQEQGPCHRTRWLAPDPDGRNSVPRAVVGAAVRIDTRSGPLPEVRKRPLSCGRMAGFELPHCVG
jgi:hypothetical protein